MGDLQSEAVQKCGVRFVLTSKVAGKKSTQGEHMLIDHVNNQIGSDDQTHAGQPYEKPKRLSRAFSALAVIVISIQSVGCISQPGGMLEGPMNGYRNHVWANRAYNLRYSDCDREFSDHFKEGFVAGYQDICNGGDGYVPAMPPNDYWSFQYQSPEGAKCVNTWFKAYPLGVKAAREDGSGSFHEVYTSKMIQSAIVQEKADHVLPDDVPVVTPEQENAQAPVDPNGSGPKFGETGSHTRSANGYFIRSSVNR